MNTSSPFVGIDVAKDELVIALGPSRDLVAVSNDESGIRHVLEHLQAASPALIVLEATGGYETAAVAALAAAGLPVVVANPRQVRAFAKAMGILAKTDNIDAHVLALFAERVRPPIRPLPDEALRMLDALLTRRRQLIEMLVAERNRLAHVSATARTGARPPQTIRFPCRVPLSLARGATPTKAAICLRFVSGNVKIHPCGI